MRNKYIPKDDNFVIGGLTIADKLDLISAYPDYFGYCKGNNYQSCYYDGSCDNAAGKHGDLCLRLSQVDKWLNAQSAAFQALVGRRIWKVA